MAAAAALNGKLTDVRKYGVLPKMPIQSIKERSPISTSVEPKIDNPGMIENNKSHGTAHVDDSLKIKFTTLRGIAAPLSMQNVDTDVIIPVRFLAGVKRTGYGESLFHALRFSPSTGEKTGFILNRVPYDKSSIIVCTGQNFGCGSSREAAVWSL